MPRADRRRKQRQQRQTTRQQRPSLPDGPIADFVIYAGAEMDAAEVESCIAALPPERATFTVAAGKGQHVQQAKVLLGDNVTSRLRAAGRSTAPYIVFLDADCRMTSPAVLDVALATLANGAGVVGGMITDGDSVLSSGYAFSITGKPYPRFAGWSADNEKVATPRLDLQAVPFAFLATHRALWRQLGLQPEYAGLPWAEVDFCLRARLGGLRVAYDPAIRVESSGAHQQPEPPGQWQQATFLLIKAGAAYDEWRVL